MDYRKGKCSSCGAEYKIPTSFAHDVAKCKECSGVVRIESAQTASEPAEPMPAKKVEKRPQPSGPVAVQASDAEQKRKERGTLAKLRAQRAAAQAGKTGQSVQASPAPKAAAPAVRRPKATAPATKRSKAAPKQPVKPAAAAKGAASGRASRPAGKRRGGDRSEAAASRRGARASQKKKGMPLGGMIGIGALVLVLAGAGLYFGGFIGGGGDQVEANETAQAPETLVEDTAPEDAPEPEPEEVEPEPEEAAPEETPEPEPVADPASVKLDEIEDFGPARGTTDEEWAELNELMDTFMDLSAGAAGPRAGRKLEEYGRKAYPVIVNHMKTLDFSTEEGFRKGDMCQKSLEKILNGRNFGWKYETEENYVYFDKKVVENYAKSWRQVVKDIEAWINMAKLDDKDPDEAARLRSEFGAGAGDLDVADPVADDALDVD